MESIFGAFKLYLHLRQWYYSIFEWIHFHDLTDTYKLYIIIYNTIHIKCVPSERNILII